MIVCLCKVTTDRDVATAVDNGARSVEDIGRVCGAGTGCGACKTAIAELIDQHCPSGGDCGSCERGHMAEHVAA